VNKSGANLTQTDERKSLHSGQKTSKPPFNSSVIRLFMDLQLSLDPGSGIPLHRQIYEEFRRLILSGEWGAGKKVPSSRELADLLDISRTTATSAYNQLLSEGYLKSIAGSGTYVSNELPDKLLFAGTKQEEKTETNGRRLHDHLSEFGKYLAAQGDFETEGRLMTGGSVSIEQAPLKKWRKLLMKHTEESSMLALEYSKDSGGYRPLREAIVEYLRRARGVRCDWEQVIIVSGSQQALDFIVRTHINRGDVAIVEDPCYFGAHRTLSACGAKLAPIAVDENGLCVDELEKMTSFKARLIYVTPSHQFPTGVVLPLPRRLKLLQWARDNNAVIVEDDYDSEFRYSGLPIPALSALDDSGITMYTGTFSKLIFPSLRLGYMVVPPDLVHTYCWAKRMADHNSPVIEQLALTDFITDGSLEHHIRRMRTYYDRKRQKLTQTIAKCFADKVKVVGENAGMHLTVRFPEEIHSDRLRELALSCGVPFRSTGANYLNLPWPQGEYVLGYANIDENVLSKSIEEFARQLQLT
jgi:GntR family transcriptional regulator/MocR family aminotransferase